MSLELAPIMLKTPTAPACKKSRGVTPSAEFLILLLLK
jgi:hypothetical protein